MDVLWSSQFPLEDEAVAVVSLLQTEAIDQSNVFGKY